MNNPRLKTVLVDFPDFDASTLPWPADADTWEVKDLQLFIGSGGFVKPKKKKVVAKAATPVPNGYPKPVAPEPDQVSPKESVPSEFKAPEVTSEPPTKGASDVEERPSSFETPGFSLDRHCLTMPVRVHCEDTAPHGHVRVESLVAFAERQRSLALKQIMNVSLADLKEQKLAILATEYVVEIVGKGTRVLDTLRVDTTPEFPSAPLFPWETYMYDEEGTLYTQGRFSLNLCSISDSGAYAGIDKEGYEAFTKDLKKWCNPKKKTFSPTNLRFFSAYKPVNAPFTPTSCSVHKYVVRGSDCDMYNVLFQARVPSMMETCHDRYDPMAFYVNIRSSVRPGDTLDVHIFTQDDRKLFICLREKEAVVACFGHFGIKQPICQEGIKCASIRLPLLLKFIQKGEKPKPCEDFDLSAI
eukprot:gnl/MRDRNA2_/MRDRNA2_104039_c0_seq1.p1 gnl/MRDRNA2_/MRDRNA2_104039_c0~~gnl/MRDRNA2_/MRDRNA2_104039_c0_seq1.p1  ORF type:complete len:413 (-),score=83.15 gnl/MRDRNA2_/MRDRNA2_104039_c0_seq1:72-1310(-)